MRILFVAGIFPPDIGGPANYIPLISQGLIEKGHSIMILCFSDNSSEKSDSSYPYKIVRVQRRQNFIVRELKTIWLGFKMARQSDVIYANGNDFKAFFIGLLSGKPRVHKIVGDSAWERAQNKKLYTGTLDDYQSDTKSWKLAFYDWIKVFPLKNAKRIITPSIYLKKIVTGWKINPPSVQVVYNSFERLPSSNENSSISLSPDIKYMCTVCRLVPWKGLDTLIKSLKNFSNLGLIIIGEGPLEQELKKLALDLHLENRVFFAGRKKKSEIPTFLEKSEFFILNSSYEGLPHVVLEAMACRKMVLASCVGGTPEVVQHGETGLLFNYNDLNSIQDAIQKALIMDKEPILEKASSFIENHFSYQKMLLDTEEILGTAAGNKSL